MNVVHASTPANQSGPAAMPAPAGQASSRLDEHIAAILVAAGLLLTALYGNASADGLIHFDDLTHYLIARWSWAWPAWLVEDWGRPGFTVLYALPAKIGWHMCRALSAILSAWSAWFAFRIAAKVGLRPAWLVVPLLYCQPLYFQLSLTTLTETALAFYLTAAVHLALSHRWSASAAVLSVGFVTRHEAIVFLPVWFMGAWFAGVRLRRLWPLVWAPLIVILVAKLIGMQTILDRFIDPQPTTQYGRGGWFTFCARSLHAFGPAAAILAVVGLPRLARRADGAFVALCIVVYFTAQTAIRALGLFASGGYARFLVAIGPLVAVAMLAGLTALLDRRPIRRHTAMALAGLSVLLFTHALRRQLELMLQVGDALAEIPRLDDAVAAIDRFFEIVIWAAAANVAFEWLVILVSRLFGGKPRSDAGAHPLSRGIPVLAAVLLYVVGLTGWQFAHPLAPPPEGVAIDETLKWMEASGYRDRPVLSAVTWIAYRLDETQSPSGPRLRQRLADAPIGSVFMWESQFAGSPDHRIGWGELYGSPSFRMIHQSRPIRSRWEPYLSLFEKTAPWDPQATADMWRKEYELKRSRAK